MIGVSSSQVEKASLPFVHDNARVVMLSQPHLSFQKPLLSFKCLQKGSLKNNRMVTMNFFIL